jgi:hypothetical protein
LGSPPYGFLIGGHPLLRGEVMLDKYGNPVTKNAMNISFTNEMMILTSGHWWWWRYSLGGVLPTTI